MAAADNRGWWSRGKMPVCGGMLGDVIDGGIISAAGKCFSGFYIVVMLSAICGLVCRLRLAFGFFGLGAGKGGGD